MREIPCFQGVGANRVPNQGNSSGKCGVVEVESITGVDVCVAMLEEARELIREKGLANC